MIEEHGQRSICGNEIYKYIEHNEIEEIKQYLSGVKIEDITDLLKALSNPIRFKIVLMLALNELPVCIISDILGIDQTLTSHHLAILREKSIIDVRIRGKYRFYYLKDKRIKSLITLLTAKLIVL